MNFKVLIAFCLICVCFTQAIFSTQQSGTKSIVGDLIQKAKEAIQKVEKLIGDTVINAIAFLESLQQQIFEEAEEAYQYAISQVKEIINDAKNQIEELKKQAEELQVDVGDCLADNEKQFENLFQSFVQNEADCINVEFNSAMKIINESIQIIHDAYTPVANLGPKLKNCGLNIICIENVLIEVAKLEVKIPLSIAKTVADTTQFLSGFNARLTICATSQLAKAGIEATGIVVDVSKCIKDKIDEKEQNNSTISTIHLL